VKLSFGEWQFGERAWPQLKDKPPPGTEQPAGGAAVAQIGDDEFIVVGQQTRVRIEPAGHEGFMLRAEEGRFDDKGRWHMTRVWNGDQVDWGLNLPATPVVLKVRMARTRP
jgi:hypothetical protein